jgi:phenylacetate-CoA ligase
MADRLLKIYHHLPGPLRSIAASLRGYYLHHWRYGPETEELIAQALEREKWSAEQWRKWQENRLSYVLYRASTQVPYYRNLWEERRRRGYVGSPDYLENWPILEKETIRQQAGAFVADDCDRRHLYVDNTSGTTGTPLKIWLRMETVRQWYAIYEARVRRWNGVDRHENWAILGGQPIVPSNATAPPYWVWNSGMNQLYLSANHLSKESRKDYVFALRQYGVTHLISYSSAATFLASGITDDGLDVPALKVVITSSEPLYGWQRDILVAGFRTSVRNFYSMAEIVAAASECPSGTLHLWPDVGWCEFLGDDNESISAGDSGWLVSTGLLNNDMPLIRYAAGDRCRRPDVAVTDCTCGRSLPALGGIEGRSNDVLITSDGKRIYWLNPIFYGIPIREAQIVQETYYDVIIRYVPAPEFNPSHGKIIIERLKHRMGRLRVTLEPVARIPSVNGKYRAIIRRFDDRGIPTTETVC